MTGRNEGSAPTIGSLLPFVRRLVLWINAAGNAIGVTFTVLYCIGVFVFMGWLMYEMPMARVVGIGFLIAFTVMVAAVKWWGDLTEWAEYRS